MVLFTNKIAQFVFEKRYSRIEYIRKEPLLCQKRTLEYLISKLAKTEYGLRYGIKSSSSVHDYRDKLPLVTYEQIVPSIERMINGERDVLWPGKVTSFAKSSGTSNNRSKYIPISRENLMYNHIKGTKDTMTLVYKRNPKCTAFGTKSIIMGGSLSRFAHNPKACFGDVSAIMTQNLPSVARPFFGMDFETALLSDWETKIDRITIETAHKDVRMIGGVPTWTIVLIEKMLKHYGVDNLLEIWANLETYIHGGVGFEPYKNQFKKYIPKENFLYHEVYNASEGYIASQDIGRDEGMLLLTYNHMYYEFLPMSEWKATHPRTITLEEVERGQTYGLVISSSSGLWRYIIGDTITFTSVFPFRIKVAGRLEQFINVFGEELMVSNAEKALATTCQKHNCMVKDYTVAPIYMEDSGKGGHEWLIEFELNPQKIQLFADDLDENIQKLNSDYAAKRYKNIALQRLEIIILFENTFQKWLHSKGKYGGQNKIPRLVNNRQVIDSILKFSKIDKAYN